MWQRRAHSRCRAGSSEPSPSADAAGVSPPLPSSSWRPSARPSADHLSCPSSPAASSASAGAGSAAHKSEHAARSTQRTKHNIATSNMHLTKHSMQHAHLTLREDDQRAADAQRALLRVRLQPALAQPVVRVVGVRRPNPANALHVGQSVGHPCSARAPQTPGAHAVIGCPHPAGARWGRPTQRAHARANHAHALL
jgi:hypothetical protein